jgi:hypothetical protein
MGEERWWLRGVPAGLANLGANHRDAARNPIITVEIGDCRYLNHWATRVLGLQFRSGSGRRQLLQLSGYERLVGGRIRSISLNCARSAINAFGITSRRASRQCMSPRDPGVYLEDIEHYAGLAINSTSGLTLDDYLADDKTRAAVERVLEVLIRAGPRAGIAESASTNLLGVQRRRRTLPFNNSQRGPTPTTR